MKNFPVEILQRIISFLPEHEHYILSFVPYFCNIVRKMSIYEFRSILYKNGEVETIEKYKIPFARHNIFLAVKEGCLRSLIYAYDRGFPLCEKLMELACKYNHRDVIEWLLERKCPLFEECFVLLAEAGANKETYNLLINNGNYWKEICQSRYDLSPREEIIKALLKTNNLELFHHLCQKGFRLADNFIRLCIEYGRTNFLCEIPLQVYTRNLYIPNLYLLAVKKGNLDTLQWLLENLSNVPGISIGYYRKAAKHGLEMMNWLYKHNFPLGEEDIEFLLKTDYFSWILEKPETLSSWFLLEYYVKHDNLDMVKKLYRQGCKLNGNCLDHAVKSNNLEMFEWILEHSDHVCKKDDFTKEMLELYHKRGFDL